MSVSMAFWTARVTSLIVEKSKFSATALEHDDG